MKKLLAVLLVALLVLTGCGKKNDGPKEVADQGAQTITIAVPAAQNFHFIAGKSNSSYDKWVRDLLHDYGVFYVDRDTAELKENTTVLAKLDVTETAEGHKTYTFTLKDGLKYNDGTAVTAKDYVASMLLRATKEWREYMPQSSDGNELVGFKAYNSGESNNFEGVKLIGDLEFSFTIDKENLPYFYEKAYVAATPEAVHTYFDYKINAEGNGFTNGREELLTAAKKVADTVIYNPTVTTGPYQFVSEQDGVVTLKLNPNHAGNYEGQKAEVGTLVFRRVNSDQVIDSLKKGEIDVATAQIEGDIIKAARAEDSGINYHTYMRNGYGLISFKMNRGATAILEVREAIGFLLNREAFVTTIAGGFGKVVNGPYGLDQWFYKENAEAIEEKAIAYTENFDKANELLNKTDYVYNQDGSTPWDATKGDGFRYNKDGQQLHIKHAGSENNAVTSLLISQLVPNAKKAGINYELQQITFGLLLDYLYEDAESDFNAFNLATGFADVYDPYYEEHSDYYDIPSYNKGRINDPQLDAAIEKMRDLDSSQRKEYSAAWLEYVLRWNELLPEVPLYSNEYHDLYLPRISGYEGKVTTILEFVRNITYIRVVETGK